MALKTAVSIEAVSVEPVEGASPFERMVAAARADNKQMFAVALDDYKVAAGSFAKLADMVEGTGSSLFHVAANYGSHEVISLLAKAYCESCGPDCVPSDCADLLRAANLARKSDGHTPLHDAICMRHKFNEDVPLRCTKALLAAGASPNIPENLGPEPVCSECVGYLRRLASLTTSDLAVDSDDDGEPENEDGGVEN